MALPEALSIKLIFWARLSEYMNNFTFIYFSDDFKTFDDSGVVSLNKYFQPRNLECIWILIFAINQKIRYGCEQFIGNIQISHYQGHFSCRILGSTFI